MKKNSINRQGLLTVFLAVLCLIPVTGCAAEGQSARDLREMLDSGATEIAKQIKPPKVLEAAYSGDLSEAVEAAIAAAQAVEAEEIEDAKAQAAEADRIQEAGAVEADRTAEAGALEAEEIEDAKAQAASVRLIMAGDILLHMRVENAALNPETGEYDFNPVFAHTKDQISAADVAIVNEEVIIGGEELGITGYPTFNAPYAIGDALAAAGFDVVCHATNHALDRGKKGLVNCLEFWRNNHPEILVTGIYDQAEEASPEKVPVIEQNGIRIAILNYTYGTNGISPPSDMPFAVSLLDRERVAAQLDLAEKEADFSVVCPHWGTEYNLGISAEQEKWTAFFREHGADVVIGTHPHVIEPVIFYGDEEEGITNNHGNGDMLVFYSLGNFVNATQTSKSGVASRMVGGMADLTFSRKENGEVSIDNYGVLDLVCHVQRGFGNLTVYPLSEYTGELAADNLIKQQDPAFDKEYCERLCEKVYADLREKATEEP